MQLPGQIHCSDVFKIDAVGPVTEFGCLVQEVAERLGISAHAAQRMNGAIPQASDQPV